MHICEVQLMTGGNAIWLMVKPRTQHGVAKDSHVAILICNWKILSLLTNEVLAREFRFVASQKTISRRFSCVASSPKRLSRENQQPQLRFEQEVAQLFAFCARAKEFYVSSS